MLSSQTLFIVHCAVSAQSVVQLAATIAPIAIMSVANTATNRIHGLSLTWHPGHSLSFQSFFRPQLLHFPVSAYRMFKVSLLRRRDGVVLF